MLQLADIFFTLLHISIIVFNLFGWLWKRTRKAHLVLVVLTIASWFVLGIWYGYGYCPITDWHWSVKEKLGETSLPSNFVEYLLEKVTGNDYSARSIDILIAVSFGLAIIAAIIVNFIAPAVRRKRIYP